MLPYPRIDPVAIHVGPLKIHWYGLMYLFGFLGAWILARFRAPRFGWRAEEIDDLVFYGALGVVLGGRIGYMLFYNLGLFLRDPLSLFRVWEGGMSFHGGLLGVLVAMGWFARKHGRGYFEVTDFIAPLVPIGLFFGRIGNFINGELWGKVTDLPWGMVFPTGGKLPRHPSQLYEALLEGVALFAILWLYSAKPRPRMAVSGLFLLGYGSFRFLVEFIREPDAHIGYLAFGWLTMGQVLSFPMIAAGLGLWVWAYRHGKASDARLP
ncbi:prolipoprotein diacylglyceryl transferase [Methylothermus subterraneus]